MKFIGIVWHNCDVTSAQHCTLKYIKFLQDSLPQHVKQDIVKELNKTQSLQSTIDTVTVALGFLSC